MSLTRGNYDWSDTPHSTPGMQAIAVCAMPTQRHEHAPRKSEESARLLVQYIATLGPSRIFTLLRPSPTFRDRYTKRELTAEQAVVGQHMSRGTAPVGTLGQEFTPRASRGSREE